MIRFREIYLSWRKERGSRRKIVGVIKRTATNGITFRYIKEGVGEAKKEGFKEYPGFPIDFNRVYTENNLDIFSLRLVPFERKDNKKLLDFWLAEGVTDKFDLLALTQGLLPTDNFEFLGKFYPRKGFRFVTDLAGLSHIELEKDTVKKGDRLNYEFEFNKNAIDNRAVKVKKGNVHIGYIKIIHDHIFKTIKGSNKLRITVKDVEQNGRIRNIFIEVDSTF